MSPWGATTVAIAAGWDLGVLVELIVPHHIVEGAIVDFIKCRTHRIVGCIASASASRLKRLGITAGPCELLAEGCPGRLHLPTEHACSGSAGGAPWKRGRIELEYEPPIDGVPFGNEGPTRLSSATTHWSRCRSTSLNLHIPSPYNP